MCWNIEHLRTGGKQINAENRQRNANGWNEQKNRELYTHAYT